MKTLGVGEIKARFADVLERVKSGEKIAVGYGKKRKKVAVIVPYDGFQPRGQRKLGPLQGKAQFEVRDGFKSDEDLLASGPFSLRTNSVGRPGELSKIPTI